MRILGLDTSTTSAGWGAIERSQDGRVWHVEHGVIRPKGSKWGRLCAIDMRLRTIAERIKPDVIVCEAGFVDSKNGAMSTMATASARSVCIVAASSWRRRDIHEYHASTVKKAVTGSGRAKKWDVAISVTSALSMLSQPPEDAADALAVAVTHARMLDA